MERSTRILRYAVFFIGIIALSGLLKENAFSSEYTDLIGKWKWRDYIVEVKECSTNPSDAGFCILVVSGAKYVGMEMLRSKFQKRGEDLYAKIADPETKELYSAKFKRENGNKWALSGCTDNGICASGKFIRTE